MFTLEIGGTPIAVADADEAEAKALFQSEDFQDDLRDLTSGGEPLWDGEKPLNIRAATDEEIAELEEPEMDEEDEDDDDDEDRTLVTFLVDIDFEDDDEDDDDDG